MKQILLAVAMVGMLIGPGHALDFTVTEVIEIGPGQAEPMTWPLKWSPDGTKLAFFNGNSLYLADTVGDFHEITTFDLPPHRYEWLTDKEIVLHLLEYRSRAAVFERLVRVDMESGMVEILREWLRGSGLSSERDSSAFGGPFKTIEGNTYYTKGIKGSGRFFGPKKLAFPESKYPELRKSIVPVENNILLWGKEGLYRHKGDMSDSVWIAPRPRPIMNLPALLSPDQRWYMEWRTLYRFSDSSSILLDSLAWDFPPNTSGATYLYNSFNPHYPEILFTVIFHDFGDYEVFRIGTFDYESFEFTIIDDLIGMESCNAPVYAPDGLKIAFVAQGRIYIIYREVESWTGQDQ